MDVIILTPPVLGQLFKKIKGIEPGLADNIRLQTRVPKTVTIYNPEQEVPFRHLYVKLRRMMNKGKCAAYYDWGETFDPETYPEPELENKYYIVEECVQREKTIDSSDDEYPLDYGPIWPIEMWALYHTWSNYEPGKFDELYDHNLREVSIEDHLDEGW